MIRTKRSRVLSARTISAFGPHSRDEWFKMRATRSWFYANTTRLWTIYVDETPVCVIGVVRRSLMGTGGEVYFLLCRAFRSHMKSLTRFIMRATRRMVRVLGALTVRVDPEFWIGNRFVQAFGFKFVTKLNDGETTHNLYELRAAWL